MLSVEHCLPLDVPLAALLWVSPVPVWGDSLFMATDSLRVDNVSADDAVALARQPFHLHLRAQGGQYALYATPLPLRLCVEILGEYLRGRYLLLLSFSSAQMVTRAPLSLAQWLRQQGMQAHSVHPAFALMPVQYIGQLALLPHSHIVFTDTPLSPDDVARIDVEQLLLDTFASPEWDAVLRPELDNRLYCESRDERFTQILCGDRPLLEKLMSCCLRHCLRARLPEFSALDDFPPLIHEQLWQYAAQGLAPLSAKRTADGAEIHVALGTPDRSVCVLAQSCSHVSQIQRGFILRWRSGGWDICSTEEMNSLQM